MHMASCAACGMAFLHAQSPSIVHRDMKSINLLIDSDWTTKVSDFGFSKVRDSRQLMTRVGTPAWAAPELMAGLRYDEVRARASGVA